MNEREALKLALEALEVATTPLAKDRQEVLRAQAAIREVLAQPEQEPVACVQDLDEVKRKHLVYEKGMDWKDPLYTTPPQRKPLSDEEIEDEWERITGHSIFGGERSEGRPMFVSPDEVIEFARAIKFNGEAK